MKKIICSFLFIIFCVICSGCSQNQNAKNIDPKLCYLDDTTLELTTPKSEVIAKKNLELNTEFDCYHSTDDNQPLINEYKFSASYYFNDMDILCNASYLITVDEKDFESFMDDPSPYFMEMKEYLTKIYGVPAEYSELGYGDGYAWEIANESSRYRIFLYGEIDWPTIEIKGIAGDARSDSQKSLDETTSELADRFEGVFDSMRDFYDEIKQ